MYHTFFIHSFAAEYLGCIHVLAFVNSAAVNMGCMYLSKLEFLRGVGLLDRMAALFLVFFFFFKDRLYYSPREGNGTPLQYSCLENPMDGGACWLPSMGSHRVGHD